MPEIKSKSSMLKVGAIVVVIFIIGIGLGIGLSGSKKNSPVTNTTTNTTATTTSSTSSIGNIPGTKHSVSPTTAIAVKQTNSVGYDSGTIQLLAAYDNTKPGPSGIIQNGSKYVALLFRFTNNNVAGSDSQTPTANFVHWLLLTGSDGKTYEPDVTTGAQNCQGLNSADVKPGQSDEGCIIYNLPDGVTPVSVSGTYTNNVTEYTNNTTTLSWTISS
jgi:hypothetical protein